MFRNTDCTRKSPLLISPAAFQGLPLRSCHWYKLPREPGLRMDKSLTQVRSGGERKGPAFPHRAYRDRFLGSLSAPENTEVFNYHPTS